MTGVTNDPGKTVSDSLGEGSLVRGDFREVEDSRVETVVWREQKNSRASREWWSICGKLSIQRCELSRRLYRLGGEWFLSEAAGKTAALIYRRQGGTYALR